MVCIILLTSEELAECVKSFIFSKMNSELEEARERSESSRVGTVREIIFKVEYRNIFAVAGSLAVPARLSIRGSLMEGKALGSEKCL
jgi:hypothetical protein